MSIKIYETEAIKEINNNVMIPVGNVSTNDARHITIGSLSDFTEQNIKNNGTFATREQLEGVSNAVAEESGVIERMDNKFTNQLKTVGEQIADLQNNMGNSTEVWEFELEDGSLINKKVVIQQ